MTRRPWLVGTVVMVVLAPRPAWAHGAGGSTDSISTLLLFAMGAAVFWFRSLKHRTERAGKLRWALVPVAALLLVASFTVPSWGPRNKPSKTRPATAARLAIVEPTSGALTGPDVALRLELQGGRIVPQSQAVALVPDSGHIHTYLDGTLVSMIDGLSQDVRGLSPGPHNLRAEFVAADHGPFKNRVVAAVLFQVNPS